MPLISSIGRDHPKVRALHGAIYTALILGAATMIYPFLIMVSGSMKSAVDSKQFDPFPAFLLDDDLLYRKHIEGLHNEGVSALQRATSAFTPSFEKVQRPQRVRRKLVEAWEAFLDQEQPSALTYTLGYVDTPVSRTLPSMRREFKRELSRRYKGDMEELNRELETGFPGWAAFHILPREFTLRFQRPDDDPLSRVYRDFKQRQPEYLRVYTSLQGLYRVLYLPSRYTRDIATYNRAHGTHHASYADVPLPPRAPSTPGKAREDWETFVRRTVNLLWVRVDPSQQAMYAQYLEARYGTVDALNRAHGTVLSSFADVTLPAEPPRSGRELSDWDAFIGGWKDPDDGRLYQPMLDALRIDSLETRFRDALRQRYGDLTAVNSALGTDFTSFELVPLPQEDVQALSFLEHKRELRIEFATRNYRAVLDYMVLHGRGILNTAIYCSLAVLCALIFNPMAAYALSRYRLPNTYKLLLFMLVVMAFPPMVTQIPVFLMLRDMSLLNTFAALLLPGLAHGYSIFLLKGFFDSLPRELYESAQLDGAGEWTMFWRITMSLSKPILAVIALQAFTLAYANFMFALLICQDEKMWTLMVWLYQLQQRSGQAVIYASLLIAAVPTFLIFFFCQNIIMRGIVVPVEK